MWANLLGSAQDPNDTDLGPLLPDILGRLSRLDAELLLSIAPACEEDYKKRTALRDEAYEQDKETARKAPNPERALKEAEERDQQWRAQLGEVGAHLGTIAKVAGRNVEEVQASVFKLRTLGCLSTAGWDTPSTFGSIADQRQLLGRPGTRARRTTAPGRGPPW